MKKRVCGVCEQSGPNISILRSPTVILGDDLFELLSKHCEGHTKTRIALIICRDCLFSSLLDSQWSVGWLRRTDFLYNVIMRMYNMDDLTSTRKKALQWVYKLGTLALSEMCIKCYDNVSTYNIAYLDLKRRGMPNWLLKANEDLLSQYVPRKNYKDYNNTLCGKCASKYEIDFIRSIPKDELPLHITDKWLFNPSSLLYEKRLKTV